MAEPQMKRSAGATAVASCAATDCTHNEDEECKAGSIEMRMSDGQAVCGTYEPDKPKARP